MINLWQTLSPLPLPQLNQCTVTIAKEKRGHQSRVSGCEKFSDLHLLYSTLYCTVDAHWQGIPCPLLTYRLIISPPRCIAAHHDPETFGAAADKDKNAAWGRCVRKSCLASYSASYCIHQQTAENSDFVSEVENTCGCTVGIAACSWHSLDPIALDLMQSSSHSQYFHRTGHVCWGPWYSSSNASLSLVE